MSIVHTRIDSRLLHGIVATQWAPKSGCTRVMVIDNEVCENTILKESMKLGRPAGTAVSIISVDTAIQNFKLKKYEGQKVFIIVKAIETIQKLIAEGIEIQSVNVGGTQRTENAIALSKRAFAQPHEVAIYKQLLAQGIEVYTQYLVTDKQVHMNELLK